MLLNKRGVHSSLDVWKFDEVKVCKEEMNFLVLASIRFDFLATVSLNTVFLHVSSLNTRDVWKRDD